MNDAALPAVEGSPGQRSRSVRRMEAAAVAAGAILLAVATTWPLALHLSDRAHDPYDTLSQAWTIDWVQHALSSDASLWNANIFFPNLRTLAYSDSLTGAAVALLPARWVGLSPLGVHNVGLVLAYAASAAAGYVFAKVVTGRVIVSLCTGVVFAFGAANTFLAQHLNIAFHPAPALAAAAVWALADRRMVVRRTWPVLVALGLVLTAQGTFSFNTLAITLLAVVAMALGRWRDLGLGGVLQVGAASITGLVLLLPWVWPYVLNRRNDAGPLSFELADLGATGANFFIVDPSLTLWGDVLGSPSGLFGEQPTFPGVTLLVLAVYGLFLWRRSSEGRIHLVAVTLVLTGLVFAVGTSDSGWRQFAPYRLVYELVPGGTALRATGRFWIVGLLGAGLLAGLAVDHLAGLATRTAVSWGRWVGAVVVIGSVLGVLAEGHRSWLDVPTIAVPAVDVALAREPGDAAVVYLPLPLDSGLLDLLPQAAVVYGTTAHHRPTPNGYSGYFPESFLALGARLTDLPAAEPIELLRDMGVRYIVVDAAAGPWDRLLDPVAAGPLRLVGEYDGDLLYAVPDRSTP